MNDQCPEDPNSLSTPNPERMLLRDIAHSLLLVVGGIFSTVSLIEFKDVLQKNIPGQALIGSVDTLGLPYQPEIATKVLLAGTLLFGVGLLIVSTRHFVVNFFQINN